ncbi:MAG: PilZ domain-containing protein [Chitinivibrionales bacterium]
MGKTVVERRDSLRVKVDDDITVYDPLENRILGYLNNISEKGIRLESVNMFESGVEYPMLIEFPGDREREFHMEVRCLWVGEFEENPDYYSAGFEFLGLSKENLRFIRDLKDYYANRKKKG